MELYLRFNVHCHAVVAYTLGNVYLRSGTIPNITETNTHLANNDTVILYGYKQHPQ
jgi:hypothetical protein